MVWIGHDTRPSCKGLVEAACQGVEAIGGQAEVKGLLTTPQLHWLVRQRNRGLPSKEGDYYTALGSAFRRLTGNCSSTEVILRNQDPLLPISGLMDLTVKYDT